MAQVPDADAYYISVDCDVLDPGVAPGVNSISPGLIDTPAFAVFPDKAALQKMIGDFMDLQLVRILGQPIDIAYCALYLASEEARFVTGQNFCIDGGLTAI